MPWGGSFIPEVLLDGAERVTELVEETRFEFLPLWHQAEEGFIPNLGENNKKSVCLMRVRNNTDSGTDSDKDQADPCPAALICPGGGYELLSIRNEGIDIAERMEQDGYACQKVHIMMKLTRA